jgi:hypothetical protein
MNRERFVRWASQYGAQLTSDLLRRSIQNPATYRRHQLGKLIKALKQGNGIRQKVAFEFANRCLWPRYDDCLPPNADRNGEVNFLRFCLGRVGEREPAAV